MRSGQWGISVAISAGRNFTAGVVADEIKKYSSLSYPEIISQKYSII
jgi:hypothetical protein